MAHTFWDRIQFYCFYFNSHLSTHRKPMLCYAHVLKVIQGGEVITKNVLKRVELCGVTRGECSPYQAFDVILLP